MEGKVIQVTDVKLAILESFPPKLYIVASGVVCLNGWENGRLIPYQYFVEPQDGIWDFDFIATAPDKFFPKFSKDNSKCQARGIVAEYIWDDLPDELKGVRVHASEGDPLARLLEDTNEQTPEFNLLISRVGNG